MRSMLRAVREKLGQFRRVLTEAGGSDEDLIFHIRKSEWERPLRDQATRALDCPRPYSDAAWRAAGGARSDNT
jgi:hemerythrin superfamily protein